jgi:anti-sigma factor (TIGR02949 family)
MNDHTEHVNCQETVDRLWAYLDGELTPEGAAGVRAHLDACTRCCPCHDFHRAFLEFMKAHARQPLPPGLRRRVFEQLLREERATR